MALPLSGDPLEELEKCKGNPNESVCASRAVIKYMIDNPSQSQSGGNVYCKCIGEGTVKLQRIIPDQLPVIIAEGLNPSECVLALRYHPCVGGAFLE